MEATSLIFWGMIFGAIGLGFITYARKQKAAVPLLSGIGLIVIPYFIANIYILVIVGVILITIPYFFRL